MSRNLRRLLAVSTAVSLGLAAAPALAQDAA